MTTPVRTNRSKYPNDNTVLPGIQKVTNSGLLSGVNYDTIEVDSTGITTDIYTFKLNTVIMAVVTLTFTDSTKCQLLTAIRT